jgi:hypothetical protein
MDLILQKPGSLKALETCTGCGVPAIEWKIESTALLYCFAWIESIFTKVRQVEKWRVGSGAPKSAAISIKGLKRLT